MSDTQIKLEESAVYCVFLITRLPSTENKSFDSIAMAIIKQGIFVSMLLNVSRFKIFGFASSFCVW